jgi:23S rRNA (pseudouridine1915-N3)-methyltransferase
VPFELRLLWAGRRQPEAWERLAADYRERIAAWVPIREQPIRVAIAGDDPGRLRREGQALAGAAPVDALWIALDSRGRALDSDRIAGEVERWRAEWHRPAVFFLGSDLGLDPQLLERCRDRWSLGPLTLPHSLARLVLLEQLYRALSRAAGHPYHRA